MRRKIFLIAVPGIIIGVVLAIMVSAFSSEKTVPQAELLKPVTTNQATAADKLIASAQAAVQNNATDPRGYNMLASAFLQKARETGDFSINARAEEAIKQSFRVAPDNYEGLKTQAGLKLVYHQFAEALEIGKRARAISPRDHEIYGILVDAQVELGDYKGAVDSAQIMVDLKPNIASYSRVSYLRSLHGDTNGAIEMMKMAISAGNPQNPESLAWSIVHLGDEYVNAGKPEDAEREYDRALYIFPDYHLALAAKARARYAANDTENAISTYKRAIERSPSPEYIASLGDIYMKLGRTEEARQQYEQVEFIEKLGASAGTYTNQLALFWANQNIRLDDALAAAEREHAVRKDIYTADIYAWCLYKKGRFAEAKTIMEEALRLGTRDSRLLYHAGMIAAATGDNQKGADYLKQALEINPNFDILQANIAKEKLSEIKGK